MSALGCRAVLFDFDGTLTRPEALDFAAVRKALGCAPGSPLLEFIDGLATEEQRQRARAILDEFEAAAARLSLPNEGVEELVALLRRNGVPFAILSRNARASILRALENFPTLREADFSFILTRESTDRPKPHPDGVHRAAELFRLSPKEVLVVGDFIYDIQAGSRAGSPTVLVTNGRSLPPFEPAPDYTVTTVAQIAPLLGL